MSEELRNGDLRANLCSGNHVEDEIKSLIYVEGTQSSKR
jgi:hypothetical protein